MGDILRARPNRRGSGLGRGCHEHGALELRDSSVMPTWCCSATHQPLEPISVTHLNSSARSYPLWMRQMLRLRESHRALRVEGERGWWRAWLILLPSRRSLAERAGVRDTDGDLRFLRLNGSPIVLWPCRVLTRTRPFQSWLSSQVRRTRWMRHNTRCIWCAGSTVATFRLGSAPCARKYSIVSGHAVYVCRCTHRMHVVSAVCRLLFFLAGVFVFVDVDVGEGGVDVVAVTLLPCLRVPIKRISPRYRYEWLVASFSIQCFICGCCVPTSRQYFALPSTS
ncbi:hypothetical protein CI102_8246 [Trichoderma harzianum]|nr:hypothetical protein CI102_8246 [Trichoderma harzianum]